ncbi:PREDICTED: uncharacterized protein LOC104718409 isoform X2 [Camelina sativa]|uniref:Uncharacterized protein LOC104718409 isoform X1 n=1 Tax=Camelina sativa TaxID=90675 RepID=A0ABM0U1H6_CAMSA|nr:PREDICTED: uncharacterized protein LOC104718409 isoform X1 [Camelina sativa]XP_010434460.1 PREDICTED: uncharacterized protein LOC104718409 isoform X2 [Camelina sativa]
MVEVIPKQIKDVWDTWNIRGMIILSLSLQTILIFFAPLRKRTPNKFLIMLLWSSYLLADLSANFAVALIAKNQGKDPKPDDPPEDKKLVALWAPFLLLHLGGPDTITAFSIEDSALWNRHFLGLVFQALAGVYVVVLSLPNVLWLVIELLFVAGTLKYLERTIALYLASSDKYRNLMLQESNSGFDYTEQADNLDMESILASEMYMKEEHRGAPKPLNLMHPDKELTDFQILQFAFLFFNNFTSLMVNNIFSLELRDKSKAFFSALQLQEEALCIIEAELDFIYEGLYTKGAVLHSSLGVALRITSLVSLLSAFTIYHYRHNKMQEFRKADIVITYTLFLVGIALEVISFLMLMLSDWTTATLSKLKDDSHEMPSLKDRLLEWVLGLKRKWKGQIGREEEVFNTPFLLRRWAGNITVFNFLTYSMNADTERIHNSRGGTCQLLWKIALYPFSYVFSIMQTWSGSIAIWSCDLRRYIIHHVIIPPPGENQVARSKYIFKTFVEFWFNVPYFFAIPVTSVINYLGIRDLFHEIRLERSVHHEPLTKNLWSFIFSELKIRSQILDNLESTTTKASARRDWASSHTQIQIAGQEKLLRYITDVDYDQSLLIWHIATELCYQEDDSAKENCDQHQYQMNREISKIISDYMMYLLILQPKLMSDVAGIGNMRFRDTLAEAKRFFKKMDIGNTRDVKLASKKILLVDTSIEPSDVKGNHCKSVLFEASSVAKELLKLDKGCEKDKWAVLSKVWLEFLFHAASHCDGTARLELVSKGGEFINFVWLLMAHFGLGD